MPQAILAPLLIGVAASAAGAGLSALVAPKAPKPVQPLPVPQARTNTALADVLNARRGVADNQRTGSAGAELTSDGLKTKLGQ